MSPVHAVEDRSGRWYVHPTTGERYPSVTTVLGYISKFGLPAWAARLTAEAAFERLPWLNKCARLDSCNALTIDDACGQCVVCATAWLTRRADEVKEQAGDRGTRLHEASEQIDLFGEGGQVDEDIAPLVDQYNRWRDACQPTFLATEMTVISHKWRYAGTLDAIIRFDKPELLPESLRHLAGRNLVMDKKSGKHIGIPEGWQVGAYARADIALLPDGTEEPLPTIEGGLILHLQTKKTLEGEPVYLTQMREVLVNDANHAAFIHLLRMVEHLTAGLNTVVGRPVTMVV